VARLISLLFVFVCSVNDAVAVLSARAAADLVAARLELSALSQPTFAWKFSSFINARRIMLERAEQREERRDRKEISL
jgi:hypothetical protein